MKKIKTTLRETDFGGLEQDERASILSAIKQTMREHPIQILPLCPAKRMLKNASVTVLEQTPAIVK